MGNGFSRALDKLSAVISAPLWDLEALLDESGWWAGVCLFIRARFMQSVCAVEV